MPDTCAAVSLLALSRPSVRRMTACRRPSRTLMRSAVRATASNRDVAPNGLTFDIDGGSCLRPVVNGTVSSSRVSNWKTATSSRDGSSRRRKFCAASRACTSCPSMLPLTSNSSATLRPATSWRKSLIPRIRPRSKTSNSSLVKSRTNRPFWSRTTAASRTRSTLDRKTGAGVSVATCSPMDVTNRASTNLNTNNIMRCIVAR